MKKIVFLQVMYCLLSSGSIAQPGAERYASSITADDLQRHLRVIASAEMEGRETATEGQRKAAAYLAAAFQTFGLVSPATVNNFQQYYPVFIDSIITTRLMVNGVERNFGVDYYSSLQTTVSANIKSKKIVFVGYGIEDSTYSDYKGKRVKGKVVVMFSGEPKSGELNIVNNSKQVSKWTFPGARVKAKMAFSKGAKAVIMISPTQSVIRSESVSRKSSLYYPGEVENDLVNVVVASHDLAADILGKENFERLLQKAKNNEPLQNEKLRVKKHVELEVALEKRELQSSNVIGYIEGTDKKDEYVILTAHYDHLGKRNGVIYFGADDDGSGTVSVLEMAEAFAQAKADGNGPRRTVVFMTVSGEEKGLWGSKYYANNPVFPLDKTSVNLNTDMVGRIDPKRKEGDSLNYVYVIGDDKLSSDLKVIQDDVNERYSQLELDRRFVDNDPSRYYYRSDHYNFAKNGVPIIFYFNGTHADYHRPSDTIEKINFELMQKRVQLIFYTAWQMANRDDMLKRDIPLK